MNSHDSDRDSESELGAGDDVTLAAGSDVVAQIRAHAAKVRRGEAPADLAIADEALEVWRATPELEPEPEPVAALVAELEDGELLPHDETIALASTRAELADAIAQTKAEPGTDSAVVDLTVSAPSIEPSSGSLIDGQATPEVSTSFWTTDQPFRASGIDAPARLRGSGGIPLAAWIALVLVVIVLASVGIAVAVATMGPLT